MKKKLPFIIEIIIGIIFICFGEKLESINRENHINSVDERKIFLRMKAGSLVYQLMIFVYLFVAFVLALLHVEAWIIGVIFGLFLLQTFLGIVLYKHFEKHF